MKQTFKSGLLIFAALIGIVGFTLMFASPISIAEGEGLAAQALSTILNALGLEGNLSYQQVYLGDGGATVSLVGFCLMAGAGVLTLVLAALAKKKGVYLITLIFGIIVAVVAVAGGIMALCTRPAFLESSGILQAVNDLPGEELREKVLELGLQVIVPNYTVWIGGLCGVVGGALTLLAVLLPGPRNKKGKNK